LYQITVPPEPLTKGLPPPDPRPLSSTEFVEHPPEKNSWVRHWLWHRTVQNDGTYCRHTRWWCATCSGERWDATTHPQSIFTVHSPLPASQNAIMFLVCV